MQRPLVAEAVQRTFATVTELVDRLQARESRRVDIDVKLPENHQVSVNLEYKNGQLHVSFRTDSAELREALSRGWSQSMSGADSPLRFAETSFGGGGQQHSRGESFDMSGGRQGQQQSRPQPGSEAPAAFALPAAKASARDGFASREMPPPRRALAPDTTRHLNVIA